MSPDEIATLLQHEESEWLDFKREWPGNTVTLLHDLLCLMNARFDGERYLVFGIDDSQNVVGVGEDSNRRNNAQVHDLLRQSNFNRFPSLEVVSGTLNSRELDAIVIHDRPDKPFYLTADKQYGGARLRAGVVYTRLGDTNTPLRECAPDEHIELMWRERFGFGLTPLRRFDQLINEVDKWERPDEDSYLYHAEYPEFTIQDGREIDQSFEESWTKKFPDPSASTFEVELRYHNTILKKLTFVRCDGGRFRIPLPRIESTNDGIRHEIEKDGMGFRIAQLFRQYRDDLETAFSITDIELL